MTTLSELEEIARWKLEHYGRDDVGDLCERCNELDMAHGPQCPDHPDYDPTPYCGGCGAMRESQCHCGPIAKND